MSVELGVKANRPVALKDLIEKADFLLKQVHASEQSQIKVCQRNSEVVNSYFDSLKIGDYPFEIAVEIPDYAKVFILFFSAGTSELLNEDGGFWAYFEAGELPCPSIVLMIILSIAYADLTKALIVDEVSLLGEGRNISVEDAVSKLKITGEQDLMSYFMKVCQNIGISTQQQP